MCFNFLIFSLNNFISYVIYTILNKEEKKEQRSNLLIDSNMALYYRLLKIVILKTENIISFSLLEKSRISQPLLHNKVLPNTQQIKVTNIIACKSIGQLCGSSALGQVDWAFSYVSGQFLGSWGMLVKKCLICMCDV